MATLQRVVKSTSAFRRVNGRLPVVRVVAFRDTQRIVEVGTEFVHLYTRGVFEGPGSTAMSLMHSMTDTEMQIEHYDICNKYTGEGPSAMMSLVNKQHNEAMESGLTSEPEQVVWAANASQDCMFCLLQTRYPDSTQYQIMKLDILLDDTSRCVKHMHIRSDLAPSQAQRLVDVNHTKGTAEQPAPDIYPNTPFSFKAVQRREKEEVNPAKMHGTVKARLAAWSTGHDESVLDSALSPEFQMWDAFGYCTIPYCDPSQRNREEPRSEQMKKLIQDMHSGYDVECRLLDSAFSLDSNVGFAHWVSHITNPETGEKFDIEGMEVQTFNKENQLSNVWMFRDPMDFERNRMKACCEDLLPTKKFDM